MAKYRLLREALLAQGVLAAGNLHEPPSATDEELCSAHDPAYVASVQQGTLSREAMRRIGFPWSQALVERARRSVGGTLAACRQALEEGCAANLAGGTHHGFADRGEGFCVFNDAAVAARLFTQSGRVRRVAVIDTDVHQGNGTAAMLADHAQSFTFSIHGGKNYPFHKETSDLDVELPDGTTDEPYLEALARGLETTLAFCPELVIFVSGADPFEGDRLGRLALSKAGLLERDRLVLESCRGAGAAVAITMAGGYARQVEDVVAIHLGTVTTGRRVFFG
jgi:acetoin utilization deacetylase AcuC-like enzyme